MTTRPRPKARIQPDLDNPYARLGVSPLASIDEIKQVAANRRGELINRRRRQGADGARDLEQQIIEIQDIEKQIATPGVRAAYDREHPQSTLLTVQAGPRDRGFGPANAASLVTAWLAEQLGTEEQLVHPDALWLWLPAGLDPVLAEVLARFQLDDRAAPATESGNSHGELERRSHG